MVKRFSTLVMMFLVVFAKLKNFIIFYLLILLFFTFEVSIYLKDDGNFPGIGAVRHFLQVFSQSYDQSQTEFKVLYWANWFVVNITSSIVLMNFVISVVSEAFTECSANKEAQNYRVKLSMIWERELLMSDSELSNPNYFPRFLIIRRPVDSQGGSD